MIWKRNIHGAWLARHTDHIDHDRDEIFKELANALSALIWVVERVRNRPQALLHCVDNSVNIEWVKAPSHEGLMLVFMLSAEFMKNALDILIRRRKRSWVFQEKSRIDRPCDLVFKSVAVLKKDVGGGGRRNDSSQPILCKNFQDFVASTPVLGQRLTGILVLDGPL